MKKKYLIVTVILAVLALLGLSIVAFCQNATITKSDEKYSLEIKTPDKITAKTQIPITIKITAGKDLHFNAEAPVKITFSNASQKVNFDKPEIKEVIGKKIYEKTFENNLIAQEAGEHEINIDFKFVLCTEDESKCIQVKTNSALKIKAE